MKRNLVLLFFTIGPLLILGVFQNCGQSFESEYYGDLLVNPVSYRSPFEENKVVFDKSYLKSLAVVSTETSEGVISDPIVAKDEEIVLFIKNECAASLCSPENSSLSCMAYNPSGRIADLDIQAYPLVLTEGIRVSEIERKIKEGATDNSCIVGLTNQAHFTLGGQISVDDPLALNQLHLDAIGFWDTERYFFGAKSLTWTSIGVIDSGMNLDHEDTGGAFFKYDNTVIGIMSSQDVSDCSGHGSMVSGIINANQNNKKGITGLIQSRIAYVSKAFSCSNTTTSDVLANAIRITTNYTCLTRRSGVINLSFSGPGGETALREAIAYSLNRGCFLVAAAGNNSRDLESFPLFPASFSNEYAGLISVASTSNNHKLSSFSNYSNKLVDIATTGENILSLSGTGNSYVSGSGTSFAAPIVTAAVGHLIHNLRAAGIQTNPVMVQEIFLRAAVEDSGLKPYVANGRRLNFPKLKQIIEGFVTNLNLPQVGLGDPVVVGSGFKIPISFSKGILGYSIEIIERFSGKDSVLGRYSMQTSAGSLELSIPILRPERQYVLVVKDQKGEIVSTMPLESNYFFRPDIDSLEIKGKIHQIYISSKKTVLPNKSDYVVEGWACIPEYHEPLELEVWSGAPSSAEGGRLLQPNLLARDRARGDFYEDCKDSKGRPHPSINVGFWFNMTYAIRSNFEEDKIFVKAKHPTNPELDKILTNSGTVFTPPRLGNNSVHVRVSKFTKTNNNIEVEGWACSFNRNEKVNVSLVTNLKDMSANAEPITYQTKEGFVGQSPVSVRTGYGRGLCSKQLSFPEFALLCSYLDIDGKINSFQDLRDDVDRSFFTLVTVPTGLSVEGAGSSCYQSRDAGFKILITDFSKLFDINASYSDIPDGGTFLQTPSANQQRLSMILKSKLKLKVFGSLLVETPLLIDLE